MHLSATAAHKNAADLSAPCRLHSLDHRPGPPDRTDEAHAHMTAHLARPTPLLHPSSIHASDPHETPDTVT